MEKDTETSSVEPRAKRQKVNHAKSNFERLKELKGKGSKNKYEVENIKNVYEIIDEKEYSKNVWERQDDWIVDDDGLGYVEDGRDFFDEDLDSASIVASTSKTNKRKKNISKIVNKGNIQSLLSNMPEKKKEMVNLDQDDILSDVLSEIDDTSIKTPKRKFDNSEKQAAKDYMEKFSQPNQLKLKLLSTIKNYKRKSQNILEELPIETNEQEEQILEQKTIKTPVIIEEEKDTKEVSPPPSENKDALDFDLNECFVDDDMASEKMVANHEEEKEFFDNVNWSAMLEGVENDNDFDETALDKSKLPLITNSNNEQVFKFFWWDAYEDYVKLPGTVYLFGKVYIESAKSYASCCVVVGNIHRKIFLLPRPFHVDSKTKEETSKAVKLKDVYDEFNEEIANRLRLPQFKSKKVVKKYAFNPDIPSQSEYLEVQYTGHFPEVDSSLKGRTFSKIFGTNTSFLELLLLDRKIKGPCWLEIKNVRLVKNPKSWCKFELSCVCSDVFIVTEDKKNSPPPLVVATINIRTVPKDSGNEIVMIGCLVHKKYHIDKQPPNPPFQQHFCVFTKPTNQVLPVDLLDALKQYKGTQVQKCDSERAMLNFFLNRFANIDPDLVVGHDLLDYHFAVLCDRIDRNKTAQWSRFGRLKKTIIPIKSKQKEFMYGRLVCDLKISARELIRARSYDLDALCQTVLKLKSDDRRNLEATDVLRMFGRSDYLIQLINLTMQDAGYITKIMYELNVMPLALQITNIAGNVMSRTLQGGRAQRNEFLLLHAFTEKDYICPDKSKFNKKETDSDNPLSSSRKKPTYVGGLVLHPKIGFYDKFILLMDFNSLYPSIIQEYNICFTTMQSNLDTETMLANVSPEPGILPTEIRKLVESRRQVKQLMTYPDISADLRMQYNIRQLALKLTANSMYGCLGFQNSRFFAKHLASLVTLKGRDILMHTRDLVQSLGFEVIYGDTDSIMINTNIVDFDQVFKIGHNIKQLVNKSYKQIELDIDGVFKYMLLLKKKKYAAVTMSKNKNGEIILQQEHKGLDIVRRDWSMIASEVGKMVLNHILSDQSADERIENIQNVLEKIANDLRENKVPTSLLVITKQLTKNPKLYADKAPLSHVLVALRYNERGGKPLGQGDVVPYVICEDGTNNAATQRAYHIDELNRSDTLKIDVIYYLAHQIHPVVSRLCEPIEGLDAYQIANFLGIDSSSFKKSKPKSAENETLFTIAPVKKFKNVKSFDFVCLNCKQINVITELLVKYNSHTYLWLEKCSNIQCTARPVDYIHFIDNVFVRTIKQFIEQYYDKTLICEDPCCTNETNIVPLKFEGKYPICDLCKAGVMYKKYSENDLYEQLIFYKHLCDISKLEKKTINPIIENGFQRLTESINYFLQLSAYSVVDLTALYKNFILSTATSIQTEDEFLDYDSDDPENS